MHENNEIKKKSLPNQIVLYHKQNKYLNIFQGSYVEFNKADISNFLVSYLYSSLSV